MLFNCSEGGCAAPTPATRNDDDDDDNETVATIATSFIAAVAKGHRRRRTRIIPRQRCGLELERRQVLEVSAADDAEDGKGNNMVESIKVTIYLDAKYQEHRRVRHVPSWRREGFGKLPIPTMVKD